MKKIDFKNPDAKLTVITTCTDPVKAELIKNVLVDHDIPCELGGEQQAGFTGTLEIEVIVLDSDVNRARDVADVHKLF